MNDLVTEFLEAGESARWNFQVDVEVSLSGVDSWISINSIAKDSLSLDYRGVADVGRVFFRRGHKFLGSVEVDHRDALQIKLLITSAAGGNVEIGYLKCLGLQKAADVRFADSRWTFIRIPFIRSKPCRIAGWTPIRGSFS